MRAGTLDQLRFDRITTALARVSINCIAWFGTDLLARYAELAPAATLPPAP